ncbi:putative phenylalanyl-tRNA synthetase [Geobacillus sp. GHH01]|uniref:B3/B4 domain-containing protein n=1 Tax=Geobacillus sp. GHH01 TaxID=1233873 RepID=UPI0002AF256B|nr:B3/4 domain-containing protein [Geobacillus sp. GHH01]AGE21221.1 putative phenylalanyl-tRNA synthetase [Geobacillus sp. GHH01]
MTRFVVEDDVWAIFPHAKIGVVVAQGIDNSIKNASVYEQMLREAEKEARKFLEFEELSRNPVISVWREAFRRFRTKKGARCSVEALLKRVKNGHHIPTINPLVDIYNCISLRYGLPCGGEDIDTFVGDIRLALADGNEPFIPLEGEENDPPYEGEIVYKDDMGVICRCWNWREAQRTMLTEQTKRAFLCMESIDDTRHEALHQALEELACLIQRHLGGTVKKHLLDARHSEIPIID